jgi:hypothetical protein
MDNVGTLCGSAGLKPRAKARTNVERRIILKEPISFSEYLG